MEIATSDVVYCATGHRPPRLRLSYDKKSKEVLISFAIKEIALLTIRPSLFHVGGAQGWDEACGYACVELDIPFNVDVPFVGQERKWPNLAQQEYKFLLSKAAKVNFVSEGGYEARKFIVRDHYMVDNSQKVFALWDGVENGGTYHTVEYATGKGREIFNVWQNWLERK